MPDTGPPVAVAGLEAEAEGALRTAPASLRRILVGVDASDHANRALAEAAHLAASAGGTVTGIHAYAAKLHDRRFRQMEGGLPERYREEAELERQRETHDSLIGRGLAVIGESYHDVAERVCESARVPYRRLSPEGKNYRRIAEAAASGAFDVLALGSLGLGAVAGGVVGSVCARVVRRSPIDTLVIRDPGRALGDGPLVVGIDGSARSFGALKTALDLGRRLGAPVHAVAAYDPYFHYVAFERIAGVLSDEAGRVFRFKEQEKLHEEIIDDGLAKIYRSHLAIAESVAKEEGVELTTELLDGKPYQAIAQYLARAGASLLLVGKTGAHADPALDIGGNTENLLCLAPCHVWIGTVTFTPPLEAVARETIAWTAEAEGKMARVPEAARAMVRTVILRYAQERGHTMVTAGLIDEATRLFCPSRGGGTRAGIGWSPAAEALLEGLVDSPAVAGIRLRAEKRARREGAATVTGDHVRPFLGTTEGPAPVWSAAALARLARIPEMAQTAVRARAEAGAREAGAADVSPAILEAVLAESRAAMSEIMQAGGHRIRGERED